MVPGTGTLNRDLTKNSTSINIIFGDYSTRIRVWICTSWLDTGKKFTAMTNKAQK
jgi:hypothetical protein